MLTRTILLAGVMSALLPAAGLAEDILFEDFQDGEADGWGAGGEGGVQLTTFAGNTSLRLDEEAAAFIAITTEGYRDVRIAAAMAASDLERGEACLLEATYDDGSSWVEVVRVEDGADDAVTLHPGAVSNSAFDNAARVILRARAVGSSDNDQCWLDNVRVTGTWIADAAAAETIALTASFLAAAEAPPSPLPTARFAPPSDALPASSSLTGRYSFSPQADASSFRVITDRFDFLALNGTDLQRPPSLEVDLVQSGDRLLPVQRGLVVTDHPFWDTVWTPGRVWREAGDGDWSRAALPFALVEKNANCTHNGLLTFLFNSQGEITRTAWQIGSETCAYFQFDAWGVAASEFQAGEVGTAAAVIARDEAERAARMPVQPVEALRERYPGFNLPALAGEPAIDPATMTAYGLVHDGTHFVGGCDTRYGAYPYCDELVIPSYSFAKSLFGGLGLMRLEQLYPGAMDARIADYVPACEVTGTWGDVTFEDALDMTTGHYQSAESEADENAAIQADFFIVGSHAEKVELACNQYPRRTEPGRQWVYHTTDTYLLGTAMQAFLREREGEAADIYRDLLVDPLWAPLGLSATLDETRRTTGPVSQPFAGWGLVMQRGDLAQLLAFINRADGMIDGEAVLPAGPMRAALQRDPSDTGLPAPAAPLRYNNGFWSWDIQAFGNCQSETPLPFLSGFGGLAGVLLPNGTSYYYVSDGYQFSWARAALATEAIAPFCTGVAQ